MGHWSKGRPLQKGSKRFHCVSSLQLFVAFWAKSRRGILPVFVSVSWPVPRPRPVPRRSCTPLVAPSSRLGLGTWGNKAGGPSQTLLLSPSCRSRRGTLPRNLPVQACTQGALAVVLVPPCLLRGRLCTLAAHCAGSPVLLRSAMCQSSWSRLLALGVDLPLSQACSPPQNTPCRVSKGSELLQLRVNPLRTGLHTTAKPSQPANCWVDELASSPQA